MNASDRPCQPYHVLYKDPSSTVLSMVIFGCIYCFLFVFGLIGNLSVIVLTAKNRSLQTVQNLFILNLAVADVFLCLLSVSLTPITTIFKEWFFGRFLCRLIGGTQAIAMFISSFSLCAIAVDRYFRLTTSPAKQLTRRGALWITAGFWTLSLAMASPYIANMRLRTYRRKICGEFCSEKASKWMGLKAWPSVSSKRLYTLFVLSVQCVIPFTIILVCYWALFAFLRKRAMGRMAGIAHQMIFLATNANAQHSDQLNHLLMQKRRVLRQKRRATFLLVLITSIFAFTTLPINLISLLTEFDSEWAILRTEDGTDFTYLMNLFSHSCAMISVVTNPILFSFLAPEFRELVYNWLQLLMPLRGGNAPPTQLSAL